jgi:hypothetical protein
MWRILFILAAAACDESAGPESCETNVSLVDHNAWRLLPEGEDPYGPPPTTETFTPVHCAEVDTGPEVFGGEMSFSVYTFQCSWATVAQQSLISVAAGEPLVLRLWYFSQTAFEPAQAEVIVAADDTPLHARTIPLPTTEGGLVYESIPSPIDIGPETTLRWHVSNHGVNSWNLIEVAVTRTGPCPE